MDRDQTVLYREEDAVAHISLNRPKSYNAQSIRMIDELDDAFARARDSHGVRAVVLQGVGSSFSSGHDMKAALVGGADEYEMPYAVKREVTETLFEHEFDKYVGKCLAIRDFPKPTIAMVRGHCIAAGWMVASMCDLVIAGEDAKFSDPVVRMACVGVELPIEFWDVGVRKAKELLFTGDALAAADAHRLGFVNHVIPNDNLETFTHDLAKRIATMPPFTVRMTKLSLNRMLDNMGQANSFWQHYVTHQLAHQTAEFKEMTQKMAAASDKTKSSLKSFLEERDRKFVAS